MPIAVKGKYNTALVFTNLVEETALEQIRTLCDQSFTAGSQIRLMPDVHAGAGCAIGTTMTIRDKIAPNLLDADIGCGMHVCVLADRFLDTEKLDAVIRAQVPAGREIHSAPQPASASVPLEELCCRSQIALERAQRSIGTLGGGNHFIEVDRDDAGTLYLVIHSGSRQLGAEVASWYERLAYDELNGRSKRQLATLIAQPKAEAPDQEISDARKKQRNTASTTIPKELAYLEGQSFSDYLHDARITQHFADVNRRTIADTILSAMGLTVTESFTTVHNYINLEHNILRKGAVSAQKGERLLIPINMRDGSLLCTGKGNPDWNCSAPHGAGRLMRRGQAQHAFTLQEYSRETNGIYTTSVNPETPGECPMASILANVQDTITVDRIIRPIYNFKASEA